MLRGVSVAGSARIGQRMLRPQGRMGYKHCLCLRQASGEQAMESPHEDRAL
jgi:hypothetical protein